MIIIILKPLTECYCTQWLSTDHYHNYILLYTSWDLSAINITTWYGVTHAKFSLCSLLPDDSSYIGQPKHVAK
jgi:hypothetical protein